MEGGSTATDHHVRPYLMSIWRLMHAEAGADTRQSTEARQAPETVPLADALTAVEATQVGGSVDRFRVCMHGRLPKSVLV